VLDQGLAVPVDIIPNIWHRDEDECDEVMQGIAAEHLRVYRRAVDSWRVPALLL
jgi:hypothetical protein